MKLILNNEEVQQYFDLQDDCIDYKKQIKDLKSVIEDLEYVVEDLQKKLQETDSVESEECNEVKSSKGKLWSTHDIDLLKDRIFYQGKYSKEEVNVWYVNLKLFPHRTIDGVISKIYNLGGCVEKGQIKPKIPKGGK